MITTKSTELLISQWGTDPRPPVLTDPWKRREEAFGQQRAVVAALRNRPDLGWALAQRLASSRRPSPLLKRAAYRWIRAAKHLHAGGVAVARRFPDVDVVILARRLHESGVLRPVLNATLIARDTTAQSVASALRIAPVDVVEAYNDLFFSVLGRKEDLAYLLTLVRPEPAAYLLAGPTASDEENLLSVGFEGTIDDVLRLAGLANEKEETEEEQLKQLKRTTFKAAAKWARDPRTLKQSPPAIVAAGLAFAAKHEIEQSPEIANAFGEFHHLARGVMDRQQKLVREQAEQKCNLQAKSQ